MPYSDRENSINTDQTAPYTCNHLGWAILVILSATFKKALVSRQNYTSFKMNGQVSLLAIHRQSTGILYQRETKF